MPQVEPTIEERLAHIDFWGKIVVCKCEKHMSCYRATGGTNLPEQEWYGCEICGTRIMIITSGDV